MRTLISEIRRRNVIRVAIAYLAVSWLLLQAGALVFPMLGLPPTVLRAVFALLVLAFLPVSIFAWIYEYTPDGLRRTSEVDPAVSLTHLTGRKLDYIVIGVLAMIVILLLLDRALLPARGISTVAAVQHATGAASVNRPQQPQAHTPPPNSIAVLPFANMSADKDDEYFSDGLSEELIDSLAQIPQLRVVGRTSSFAFKNKNEDLRSIGRALNVGAVLEGSVRKSGDRLRISTQLINVADGFELWSETYDRQLTDVFAVQDGIAGAVVAALKVKLLPDQHPQGSQHHRTSTSAAYNQYLLGREFFHRANGDNYRRAVDAYRKAVALDPNFAAAWAGLAIAQAFAAEDADTAAAANAGRKQAMAAANRSLAIDPNLAEGYAARGYLRSTFTWDWNGAREDFRHALALNPGLSATRQRHAYALATLGRLPDAIASVKEATELDPLSAPAWQALGVFYSADGELPAARRAIGRALEINPDYDIAHYWLGVTALLNTDADAAMASFGQVSQEGLRLTGLAMTQHSLGHKLAAQRALDALTAKYAHTYAYQIADVHAWRGETDQAFVWLDRAREQHDGGLSDLRYDPLLASLRGDPRFSALLTRMGLPL